MSTNVGDNRPGTGRHYTVAELVARERAAERAAQRRRPAELTQSAQRTQRIAPVSPPPADSASTQSLHVTELLRREGVDYAEDTAEEPPPALAAPPQRDRGSGNSRVAMMSKAAVLFGLTVGGIVGLQSTIATSPDDTTTAARSGGTVAAPRGIDASSATTTLDDSGGGHSGGGAAPTTSADVVLRDNTTSMSPQSPQYNPPSQQGTTDGARPSVSTTTPPPAPTTESQVRQRSLASEHTGSTTEKSGPEQTQRGQTSPEQTQQQTDSQQPTQPSQSGDDGDDQSTGVLDPLTGTVSGVLDTATSLLGL